MGEGAAVTAVAAAAQEVARVAKKQRTCHKASEEAVQELIEVRSMPAALQSSHASRHPYPNPLSGRPTLPTPNTAPAPGCRP